MAIEVDLETGESRGVPAPKHEFSMRECMAFVTPSGQLRCPQCGCFIKPNQRRRGGCFYYAGGIVHLMPHCAHCEESDAE